MCMWIGSPLSVRSLFFLASCNMFNVVWCVTHAFMILVVLGCAQLITPCHNSPMWLNVGCLGWHHIAWSGIGNCNIIILLNLHDAGGCFFSKSFERGKVIFLSCSFFGRSGSCSERLADMSGSSSEQLARFLHVVIRKRSGSSSLYLVS